MRTYSSSTTCMYKFNVRSGQHQQVRSVPAPLLPYASTSTYTIGSSDSDKNSLPEPTTHTYSGRPRPAGPSTCTGLGSLGMPRRSEPTCSKPYIDRRSNTSDPPPRPDPSPPRPRWVSIPCRLCSPPPPTAWPSTAESAQGERVFGEADKRLHGHQGSKEAKIALQSLDVIIRSFIAQRSTLAKGAQPSNPSSPREHHHINLIVNGQKISRPTVLATLGGGLCDALSRWKIDTSDPPPTEAAEGAMGRPSGNAARFCDGRREKIFNDNHRKT